MVTWDNAQTICQTLSSDSTSATLTFFKLMMNAGYKYILLDLGRSVTENIQTASTVADQQWYQLPPDFVFLKTIKITVDDVDYPIQEEESQEMWDYLNSNDQGGDTPQFYFLRPNFGVSGAEIGIYPTPSTASNTITIVYEASDKDMSNDAYTTGTVTMTNNSATITGSGTTFTAAMVGRYIKPTGGDGLWYRIASFTSTTVMTAENVYEGTTISGAAYSISEIFNLPEEIQILPCYYSLAHYFGVKKDAQQEAKYWTLFNQGVELAKKRWGTKTRSAIVRAKNYGSFFESATPSYFPSEAS